MLACRRCEELAVETAAAPVRIIPKSLASDRVIIDTIVNKYCDHRPLFRQSAISHCQLDCCKDF
jgi:transposase